MIYRYGLGISEQNRWYTETSEIKNRYSLFDLQKYNPDLNFFARGFVGVFKYVYPKLIIRR